MCLLLNRLSLLLALRRRYLSTQDYSLVDAFLYSSRQGGYVHFFPSGGMLNFLTERRCKKKKKGTTERTQAPLPLPKADRSSCTHPYERVAQDFPSGRVGLMREHKPVSGGESGAKRNDALGKIRGDVIDAIFAYGRQRVELCRKNNLKGWTKTYSAQKVGVRREGEAGGAIMRTVETIRGVNADTDARKGKKSRQRAQRAV